MKISKFDTMVLSAQISVKIAAYKTK
jgi:hypothetical protein